LACRSPVPQGRERSKVPFCCVDPDGWRGAAFHGTSCTVGHSRRSLSSFKQLFPLAAVGIGIGIAIGAGTQHPQATNMTIEACSLSTSIAMAAPGSDTDPHGRSRVQSGSGVANGLAEKDCNSRSLRISSSPSESRRVRWQPAAGCGFLRSCCRLALHDGE